MSMSLVRSTLLLATVSTFSACTAAHVDRPTAPARLSRTSLREYRGPSGELLPVETTEDWLKRRAESRRGVEAVMGSLPGDEKRCPLAPKVLEEVDCGAYVRRLITYASEPGGLVPAYLCIPKR